MSSPPGDATHYVDDPMFSPGWLKPGYFWGARAMFPGWVAHGWERSPEWRAAAKPIKQEHDHER